MLTPLVFDSQTSPLPGFPILCLDCPPSLRKHGSEIQIRNRHPRNTLQPGGANSATKLPSGWAHTSYTTPSHFMTSCSKDNNQACLRSSLAQRRPPGHVTPTPFLGLPDGRRRPTLCPAHSRRLQQPVLCLVDLGAPADRASTSPSGLRRVASTACSTYWHLQHVPEPASIPFRRPVHAPRRKAANHLLQPRRIDAISIARTTPKLESPANSNYGLARRPRRARR